MMAPQTALKEESKVLTPSLTGESAVDNVEILGVPVAKISLEDLFAFYDRVLENNLKGWISYVNIHTVNIAQEHSWLLDYLDNSLLNYCDGHGVRLGAWILKDHIPIRFTLADHWEMLCKHFEKKGISVFFLGTTPEVMEKAVQNVKQRHPNLKILGWHHGYFPIFNGIDIVTQINKLKPDILFVGMGMPIQEMWIQKNIDSLDVKIAWSAGGLFDFLAGVRRRPPQFIGRMGMEWLFRLLQEPKRLWRRYLLGIPLFLYRVMKQASTDWSRTQGKLSP